MTSAQIKDIIQAAIADALKIEDHEISTAVIRALHEAGVAFCSQEERHHLDFEYMMSIRARPAQTAEETLAEIDRMP